MRPYRRSFPQLTLQDPLALLFRSFSTTSTVAQGKPDLSSLLRAATAQARPPSFQDRSRDQIHFTPRQTPSRSSYYREEDETHISTPDWSKLNLKIVKQLYRENSEIAKLSPQAVQDIRNLHQMKINGSNIPNPISKFSDIEWPQSIVKGFERNTFATPFPIQQQVWPMALQGHDIVGVAETGSGKTLAYLLPGLVHLQAQNVTKTPVILILAPTRELSQQIFQEFLKFSSTQYNGIVLYGGDKREYQLSKIRRTRPEVIVATPGRLIDFIQSGYINLNRISYLVLDEADRLLDMGFEPQMRKIISQTPPSRQTLMFTATWPREVRNLALDFMDKKFLQLTVGSDQLQANPNVTQMIVQTDDFGKQELLLTHVKALLQQQDISILIFCNTKLRVEDIVDLLTKEVRVSVKAFHSDKSQSTREMTLDYFKRGSTKILVATDAAARGLDVKNISCVINYDLPRDIESYVHRIGRTGRAGSKGTAISYFTNENAPLRNSLVTVLKQANQEVPVFLDQTTRSSNNNNNRNYNQSHRSRPMF